MHRYQKIDDGNALVIIGRADSNLTVGGHCGLVAFMTGMIYELGIIRGAPHGEI